MGLLSTQHESEGRAAIVCAALPLLVRSPMCTALSTWQSSNTKKRDPKIVATEKKAGLVRLSWMCKLYMKQAKAGRLFRHEHPANAT